jgi:hypothetical protein
MQISISKIWSIIGCCKIKAALARRRSQARCGARLSPSRSWSGDGGNRRRTPRRPRPCELTAVAACGAFEGVPDRLPTMLSPAAAAAPAKLSGDLTARRPLDYRRNRSLVRFLP